jgi:hypothetical protein
MFIGFNTTFWLLMSALPRIFIFLWSWDSNHSRCETVLCGLHHNLFCVLFAWWRFHVKSKHVALNDPIGKKNCHWRLLIPVNLHHNGMSHIKIRKKKKGTVLPVGSKLFINYFSSVICMDSGCVKCFILSGFCIYVSLLEFVRVGQKIHISGEWFK